MKVLITGVCGDLGHVLSSHLSKDLEIVATDIHPSPRDIDRGEGKLQETVRNGYVPEVNYFSADLREEKQVTALFNKVGHVDAVIHLANHPARTTPWKEVRDTNINGSVLVLDEAMKRGADFIYSSSGGVYGAYENEANKAGRPLHLQERPEMITESTPRRPEDQYSVGKIAVEAEMQRQALMNPDRKLTSLRIGCTRLLDDPDDGSELGKAPASYKPIVRQQKIWITHPDLAQITELALQRKTPGFEAYNAHSQRPDQPGVYISVQKAIDDLGYKPSR